MSVIEIYSDFACPHCYVAHQRLVEAAGLNKNDSIKVDFRAFQLNPTLLEAGISRDTYRERKFGSLDHARRLDKW